MPTFDLELPANLDHLADARHRLRRWLAEEVLDDVARDDLLAVAGEFFVHVVFRTGGSGRARILAERGDGGVRLSVTAAAERPIVRPMAPSRDPLASGAVGRRLVEGCCDEVRVGGVGTATVGAECFRSVPSS